jgi:hypothetical protein
MVFSVVPALVEGCVDLVKLLWPVDFLEPVNRGQSQKPVPLLEIGNLYSDQESNSLAHPVRRASLE